MGNRKRRTARGTTCPSAIHSWAVPHPVLMWGGGGEGPPVRKDKGTPIGKDGGTPHRQGWWGIPLSGPGWGCPFPHLGLGPWLGYPCCGQTHRQTCVKTLPSLVLCTRVVTNTSQWQIQDFPDGSPALKGAPTYYFTNFSRKPHETKILAGGIH